MKNSVSSLRGFTLLELMVTIAIAAILMFIAVPSLVTFKRNAELTSATNTLVAGINAARGEAMKRGMSALIVPANNGTDWNAGWVVFVDKSKPSNNIWNESIDGSVLIQGPLQAGILVSGTGVANASPPYIKFDASGYSKDISGGFANMTIQLQRTDVAASEQPSQTRRIKVFQTGRVRVCKPTDANCGFDQLQ